MLRTGATLVPCSTPIGPVPTCPRVGDSSARVECCKLTTADPLSTFLGPSGVSHFNSCVLTPSGLARPDCKLTTAAVCSARALTRGSGCAGPSPRARRVRGLPPLRFIFLVTALPCRRPAVHFPCAPSPPFTAFPCAPSCPALHSVVFSLSYQCSMFLKSVGLHTFFKTVLVSTALRAERPGATPSSAGAPRQLLASTPPPILAFSPPRASMFSFGGRCI